MNRELLSQKRLICNTLMRIFAIVVTMSITISGSLSVKADEKVSVAYDYPITIYSSEWKELKSVEERRIACCTNRTVRKNDHRSSCRNSGKISIIH